MELAEAVAASRSYREVLIRLRLAASGGGSYATVQRRIASLGLDTSHFLGQGWNLGNASGTLVRRRRHLSEILVEHSDYESTSRLKSRLLRGGLLLDRCAVCGLEPRWNGRPLVLRLDHINGVRTDNRIENLRLVCPNCDSQLPTFAGRNARKGKRAASVGDAP